MSPVGQRGLRRPVRRLSLAGQAYEAIIEAIFDRQLQPGAQLSIDGAARELGMSITPVREALSQIAAQRLVLQESNRGYTVAPLLSARDFHDLFAVRRLLEEHALEVMELDAEAIECLRRIASQMPIMENGAHYRDYRDFNLADREFHRTIVSMSGNEVLLRSWDDLHFHLHVGRLYAGVGLIDLDDALREHSEIVSALRKSDPRAALQALTAHVRGAEARLSHLPPNGATS